jgi:hypothetical protein
MAVTFLKKNTYSSIAIFFIAASLFTISFCFNLWKSNRVIVDSPSYYAYLPSLFIYHDIHLNYVNDNPGFFKDKIWFIKAPNGNRLIKHTLGLSVALSPFFFLGHVLAPLFNAPQDGYSLPYQNSLSVGVLIYLFLGLFFLRKTLLRFFEDQAVALTLVAITLGTTLLWYSTFEGLMNHSVSFSLLCFCMYFFFGWIETGTGKKLIFFSICFGVIILIRPLAATLLPYFVIVAIFKQGGINDFLKILKTNRLFIGIGAFIILALFSLQLFYWKYITGQWFFDPYGDEHFIFQSPMFLSFLLSFRKGWLIYTPVMWFMVLGMIKLYKDNRRLFYSTAVVFVLTVYIYSSWWAWSYGISWGVRPMIDSYSFFSIPMASAFSFLLARRFFLKALTYTLVTLLISFNLFQTWQYKNGLIHFDNMTRESYFIGLFQTKASWEWYDALEPYDFQRRIKGLPQIKYDKIFFNNLKPDEYVCLRGSNFNLCSSAASSDVITCTASEVSTEAAFQIIRLGGDTIAIKKMNGKYLSINPSMRGIVFGDAEGIGFTEKFILKQLHEDENQIALQAFNNKYVSVIPELKNVLSASSENITKESIFRVYLLDTTN